MQRSKSHPLPAAAIYNILYEEIEEVDEKVKKALREYAIQEPRLAIILKGVGLM